jgi:hypothetical protein
MWQNLCWERGEAVKKLFLAGRSSFKESRRRTASLRPRILCSSLVVASSLRHSSLVVASSLRLPFSGLWPKEKQPYSLCKVFHPPSLTFLQFFTNRLQIIFRSKRSLINKFLIGCKPSKLSRRRRLPISFIRAPWPCGLMCGPDPVRPLFAFACV